MRQSQSDTRLFKISVVAALAAAGCIDSSPNYGQQGGSASVFIDAGVADEFAGDPREVPSGKVRLRVNVQGLSGDARSVGGDLQLCNSEGCVRAGLHGPVGSAATPDATTGATTLADVVVPAGSYARIAIANSSLELEHPLVLESGTRTELFMDLGQRADGTAAPRLLAANPVALDADRVALYQPGHALHVRTDDGLDVTLGEQSYAEPFVLGVSEVDIGGPSKHVALTPLIELATPAHVKLPIESKRIPRGLELADYQASLNDELFELDVQDQHGSSVELELLALGDLRLASARPYIETVEGDSFASPDVVGDDTILKAAAPTDACANALKANLASYKTALSTSQAIRITECEGVFPFVHILMVNMGVGPAAPAPRYPWIQFATAPTATPGTYILKRLANHVTDWGAFLGINGYMWDGQEGTADLQTGTFKGTVYLAGSQKHSTTSAEAIIGFASSSSSSGTGSKLFAKAANTNPSLVPFNQYAHGSTTSIMKTSVCSRTSGEGPTNLWSSIGIGNSRLIMMSSVTNKNGAEAYDYCALYSALQSTDAIRLDGGPSAAIYFGGRHLNPLGALWSIKYGSARRIISAIVAK